VSAVVSELNGQVVVGYDGTDSAELAVDWAAMEAARRGVPLSVVFATDFDGMLGGPRESEVLPSVSLSAAEAVARDGAVRARNAAPGLEVTTRTRVGAVAGVLVELSSQASLVVLGTRGHGPLAGALLGSVAFAVTAHAACPVVVVRGEAPLAPGRFAPIMVGVDGSPECRPALRFAAEMAAAAGAPLTVLCAWKASTSEAWEAAYWSTARPGQHPQTAAELAAQQVAREAVEMVRGWLPEVDVRYRTVCGPARHLLPIESRSAGLLVVGARGGGGFAGLHLGSTGRAAIHEALCPVAVVRDYSEQVPETG
jgi:nucleotide-binding universal stress UspA family protein